MDKDDPMSQKKSKSIWTLRYSLPKQKKSVCAFSNRNGENIIGIARIYVIYMEHYDT